MLFDLLGMGRPLQLQLGGPGTFTVERPIVLFADFASNAAVVVYRVTKGASYQTPAHEQPECFADDRDPDLTPQPGKSVRHAACGDQDHAANPLGATKGDVQDREISNLSTELPVRTQHRLSR
jgi:hypothetical protein